MIGNVRPALAVLVLIAAAATSGCVTLPPNAPRSAKDPLERWNRGVYRFNDVLDRAVAKPVARSYVRVVPKPMRTGVSNFFANLETPSVMMNDALEGHFKAAASDLGRFLLDSTVGIAGLLDPATAVGLDHNTADFGVTLGTWGVHPGPFIELPLLGPSDLRDAPAAVVDTYANPTQYVSDTAAKYSLWGVNLVRKRADLLPLDATLKTVFDPYAFVRDAYLQHRAYEVSTSRGDDSDDSPDDPDSGGASPR
ncbi:MAG: VacJ family lipoprotein [Gammaproteobacteria bacterium]|nr:VacJ family lipoprotein [Gammaproteobacteria bacterium]